MTPELLPDVHRGVLVLPLVVVAVAVVVVVVVRFYIALFSALGQTHCALMLFDMSD